MIYIEPNYDPKAYYPIAVALAVLTGRVGLYCPTEEGMRLAGGSESATLLTAIGQLLALDMLIPIGPESKLHQCARTSQMLRTHIRRNNFIDVDPVYHNEVAKKDLSEFDDEELRLIPLPDNVPREHCLRVAERLPQSRIEKMDDQTRVAAGLAYLISTDLALCSRPLTYALTGETIQCSAALQHTWMRAVMYPRGRSYVGCDYHDFRKTRDSGLWKPIASDPELAEDFISILTETGLKRLNEIPRTALIAVWKMSEEDRRNVREDFRSYCARVSREKEAYARDLSQFIQEQGRKLDRVIFSLREGKGRKSSKLIRILSGLLAVGICVTPGFVKKCLGLAVGKEDVGKGYEYAKSLLEERRHKKENTLWLYKLLK